jgi:isocitrate lyase
MYPDQSLYATTNVPTVVKRINAALSAATRSTMPRQVETGQFAPIMADAEAGFGGVLNAFELMKS